MYKIYRFLSLIIYPFLWLLASYRIKINKEESSRVKEKFGFYNKPRPSGKLIWFHCASVGEFYSIIPLLKKITESYPQYFILLTTVTITAADIAKKNLPANCFHQFAPFDSIICVRRFLKHWTPNLILFTESEFWPNMISEANSYGPIILINGRMSFKSFKKWQYAKKLLSYLLEKFSLILVQSIETQNYFREFTNKNILYLGNLKYVAANFNYNQELLKKLQLLTSSKTILMLASSHPGEEIIFFRMQQNLKIQFPELITIIAPRHINRTLDIITQAKDFSLNLVLRSNYQQIDQATDIILIDTMGEFGLFYRLSSIVAVGGSWQKIGHNFIEPAKLDNLIIFGPNMQNSQELAQEFLKKRASLLAKSPDEITQIVSSYLKQPKKYNEIKNNAISIVAEMDQVQENIFKELKSFLRNL